MAQGAVSREGLAPSPPQRRPHGPVRRHTERLCIQGEALVASKALYEVQVWNVDQQQAAHGILTTGVGLAESVDKAEDWVRENVPADTDDLYLVVVGRA